MSKLEAVILCAMTVGAAQASGQTCNSLSACQFGYTGYVLTTQDLNQMWSTHALTSSQACTADNGQSVFQICYGIQGLLPQDCTRSIQEGSQLTYTNCLCGGQFQPSCLARTVIGDYDGDGRTDYDLWRRNSFFSGEFVIDTQAGGSLTQNWGAPFLADIPVPGDYDGDGRTDYAVYRPSNGTFYSKSSATGVVTTGVMTGFQAGDIPAPGDYDGDGITDFATWRMVGTQGTFFVLQSRTHTMVSFPWGTTGDIPVPGDYDGDGKTDYAVWRPNSIAFFVSYASGGGQNFYFSGATSSDVPAVGDYDGDGKTDMALWRLQGSQAWFYVNQSSTGTITSFPWGTTGDIPVPGDYDGDGKTDYAVWRPSTIQFFVTKSSGGTANLYFTGARTTDTPVLKTR